mgnify:FL=1
MKLRKRSNFSLIIAHRDSPPLVGGVGGGGNWRLITPTYPPPSRGRNYAQLLKTLCIVTSYWLLVTILSGCAVTGPYVSEEEIKQAGEDLKVKALKFQIDYLAKVNNIGYKILLNLPDEDKKGDFIFSGLLLSKNDKYFKQLYNLPREDGVVVIGVVEDSPAKKSGIMAGDLLKKADGFAVMDIADAAYVFSHKAPGQNIELTISRAGMEQKYNFKLYSKPLDVSFRMVDEQEVNAGATPNLIVVTYGLMRFTKSDDEVAAVLGHELAHISKGHHLKGSGINLVSMLAGIAAGIGANKVSPGSGDVVMRSVSAAFGSRFSRDFEREADYFGLKYVYRAGFNIEAGADVWERFAVEIPQSMTRNFFSTHPSSPERMVRLKKIIQELKFPDNSSGQDAAKRKK